MIRAIGASIRTRNAYDMSLIRGAVTPSLSYSSAQYSQFFSEERERRGGPVVRGNRALHSLCWGIHAAGRETEDRGNSTAMSKRTLSSLIWLARGPMNPALTHCPHLLQLQLPSALLTGVSCCHFSSQRRTPYQVLDVKPSASEKEIKLAYYNLAKKFHPDLHRDKPFDEQVAMKKRFQEAAAAYEYLTAVRRGERASLDSGGSGSSAGGAQGAEEHPYDRYTNYTNAEDIFTSVLQDSEVLTEVFGMMLADMQAEFGMAVEAAGQGDFDYLWEIAKANKGVIFGVALPTALIVRFPAMLPLIARWVLYAAQTAFVGLLQSGKTKQLSMMLWSQIIRNSETQISYFKLKEAKRREKLGEYQRRRERDAEIRKDEHQHKEHKSSSASRHADDGADADNKKKSAYSFRWKSKK